jgi:TRAP-type uncharacterized transport system substrate-binding protein
MSSTGTRTAWPGLLGAFLALAIAGIGSGRASAQTYGFATLPPGTLNHTTASAISKVVKEKGGVNMLVQPTAGDNVINPLVGRGEVEIGITNIMEVTDALEGGLKDMRIITAAHALRTPLFVRKDSGMFKNADLKGKRVTMGYSAMRNIDKTVRAMLASAGLTDADVKPVLVPNVVRSADEFASRRLSGPRRSSSPRPRRMKNCFQPKQRAGVSGKEVGCCLSALESC